LVGAVDRPRSSARPRRLFGAVAIAAVVLATALGACSGSGGDACATPVREELDPGYLVHVVDPSTARFRTDPPTSGPHISGAAPTGVLTAPILGAVQVAILERGDVLVQYRPAIAAGDQTALNGLVGDHVVVAPNATLPAPIVATSWTYKLTCDALDTATIERFVRAHAGKPINP
jgi:hypothetical protein